MLAVWTALEDGHPDPGPVMFYPGLSRGSLAMPMYHDDADGGFEEVAELTFSKAHQTSTNGNYRMTPLKSLKGESSTAPLPIAEQDREFRR